MSDDELFAYCAGFFDGEGHIICYKYRSDNNYPHIQTGATNTILAPIKLLLDEFGGRVVTRDRKANPNHKNTYNWICSNIEECGAFLESVLPYLLIKREKTEAALFILEHNPKITGDKLNSELIELVKPHFDLFGGRIHVERKRNTYICKNCSIEFLHHKKNKLYCSKKCSDESMRENWRNQYASKSKA